MVNKILVAVDGSSHAHRAVAFASQMAKLTDAVLCILHVAKPTQTPKGISDYIRSERINEAPHALYLDLLGKNVIDTAMAEIGKERVNKIQMTVIEGDPAEEIVGYARDHGFDLIVIGSRGSESPKYASLGSVASKVSHTADTTCVIVRMGILDNKKVLVVDDELDVLETLEDLLSMCDVKTASTFKDAKHLLENELFDIAILDIMGVEGYKLLAIAKEKKVIPVMLTAHALSLDDILKSYKEGAASYIPKDNMANITTYLKDVLEAQARIKHPWSRWLERFGSYFAKQIDAEKQGKGEKSQ